MTGHHRIGAQINGEDLSECGDPGPDPVSRMGEIPPGLDINATKKSVRHAPGNDLVMRCGVPQGDQLAARNRHGGSSQFGLENQPSGRAADSL